MPLSKPRPNLFIIGAMKSGTTSLHGYIDSHPQVFMCKPKEPKFFSRTSNLLKGEEWYLDLFSDAGDALVIGESSTEYSKAPEFGGVPQRIARFNPDARFIYIMRDPIERTISHYWLSVRSLNERRDMLTAIQQDPHYLDVSHYAMQLALYFDIFGRDKVLCLTLEAMRRNPSDIVRKLFIWLGVDPSFKPPILEKKKNVTPRYILKNKSPAFITVLTRSHYWKAMRSSIPLSLRSIGSRFLKEKIDRTTISTNKVVEFLRPIQIKQTRSLSKMLGVQFPEWTTLFNNTPSTYRTHRSFYKDKG
jgi:hypothetical protein